MTLSPENATTMPFSPHPRPPSRPAFKRNPAYHLARLESALSRAEARIREGQSILATLQELVQTSPQWLSEAMAELDGEAREGGKGREEDGILLSN